MPLAEPTISIFVGVVGHEDFLLLSHALAGREGESTFLLYVVQEFSELFSVHIVLLRISSSRDNHFT